MNAASLMRPVASLMFAVDGGSIRCASPHRGLDVLAIFQFVVEVLQDAVRRPHTVEAAAPDVHPSAAGRSNRFEDSASTGAIVIRVRSVEMMQHRCSADDPNHDFSTSVECRGPIANSPCRGVRSTVRCSGSMRLDAWTYSLTQSCARPRRRTAPGAPARTPGPAAAFRYGRTQWRGAGARLQDKNARPRRCIQLWSQAVARNGARRVHDCRTRTPGPAAARSSGERCIQLWSHARNGVARAQC